MDPGVLIEDDSLLDAYRNREDGKIIGVRYGTFILAVVGREPTLSAFLRRLSKWQANDCRTHTATCHSFHFLKAPAFSRCQPSSACRIKEDLRLISEAFDLIDDRVLDFDARYIQSPVPGRADENSPSDAHITSSY